MSGAILGGRNPPIRQRNPWSNLWDYFRRKDSHAVNSEEVFERISEIILGELPKGTLGGAPAKIFGEIAESINWKINLKRA